MVGDRLNLVNVLGTHDYRSLTSPLFRSNLSNVIEKVLLAVHIKICKRLVENEQPRKRNAGERKFETETISRRLSARQINLLTAASI